MDKWSSIFKDLISLGMFLFAPVILVWKGLDSWGKRTATPLKKMEGEVEELKKTSLKHDERIASNENRIENVLELVISYFKK